MKLKWFSYIQTNIRGYLVEVEGEVAHLVAIQAPNATVANAIATDLLNMNDYCECCGHRWNKVCEEDGRDVPHYYDEPITKNDFHSSFMTTMKLKYMDGTSKTLRVDQIEDQKHLQTLVEENEH